MLYKLSYVLNHGGNRNLTLKNWKKCLKNECETLRKGRFLRAAMRLFGFFNLTPPPLLKRHSIIQESKPFWEDRVILLFNAIYHLFFIPSQLGGGQSQTGLRS